MTPACSAYTHMQYLRALVVNVAGDASVLLTNNFSLDVTTWSGSWRGKVALPRPTSIACQRISATAAVYYSTDIARYISGVLAARPNDHDANEDTWSGDSRHLRTAKTVAKKKKCLTLAWLPRSSSVSWSAHMLFLTTVGCK